MRAVCVSRRKRPPSPTSPPVPAAKGLRPRGKSPPYPRRSVCSAKGPRPRRQPPSPAQKLPVPSATAPRPQRQSSPSPTSPPVPNVTPRPRCNPRPCRRPADIPHAQKPDNTPQKRRRAYVSQHSLSSVPRTNTVGRRRAHGPKTPVLAGAAPKSEAPRKSCVETPQRAPVPGPAANPRAPATPRPRRRSAKKNTAGRHATAVRTKRRTQHAANAMRTPPRLLMSRNTPSALSSAGLAERQVLWSHTHRQRAESAVDNTPQKRRSAYGAKNSLSPIPRSGALTHLNTP